MEVEDEEKEKKKKRNEKKKEALGVKTAEQGERQKSWQSFAKKVSLSLSRSLCKGRADVGVCGVEYEEGSSYSWYCGRFYVPFSG